MDFRVSRSRLTRRCPVWPSADSLSLTRSVNPASTSAQAHLSNPGPACLRTNHLLFMLCMALREKLLTPSESTYGDSSHLFASTRLAVIFETLLVSKVQLVTATRTPAIPLLLLLTSCRCRCRHMRQATRSSPPPRQPRRQRRAQRGVARAGKAVAAAAWAGAAAAAWAAATVGVQAGAAAAVAARNGTAPAAPRRVRPGSRL